jgi:hypothetical protein
MSMSGRLSVDNASGSWGGYGALPQYAPDGVPLTPNHGRRSSIYRAQNSTLFSAFEEDGLRTGDGLTDLQEEDDEEDSDDGPGPGRALNGNGNGPANGNGGVGGRTLVGKGANNAGGGSAGRKGEVDGGRHPVYANGGV